jgi:hypothetical protein
MQTSTKFGVGSLVVGGVLAIVFGILSATGSDSNQGAYMAAAITCGAIALVSLIVVIVQAARN